MMSHQVIPLRVAAVLTGLAVVLALGVSPASAIDYSVINDHAHDGLIINNSTPQTGGDAAGTRLIGSSATAGRALNTAYFFELPDASLLMSTTQYAMEFYYILKDNSPTFNADLYGLGFRPSPAALDTEWFFEGTLDAAARSSYSPSTGSVAAGSVDLVHDSVITPASTPGTRIAAQSTALDHFVRSLYDDGAIGGNSAVFRFSADTNTTGLSGSVGYRIVMDSQGGNAGNRATFAALNVPFAGDTFDGLTPGSTIGGATSGADLSDGNANWGFAWVQSGTQPATVASASMSFSNNAGTVDGRDTALEIHGAYNGSTALNNNPARRALDSTFDGDELYFRYIVRAGASGLDSNDFFIMWLDNEEGGDSSNHNDTSAFLGIRGGDTFFARINGVPETGISPGITAGEDYMLVGRLYRENPGDGFNMLDFWVNPEGEDQFSPDGTLDLGSANTAFNSITHFGFRTGQFAEISDTFLVDAIALGTNWSQVVPTPEPGTVALLATGLLILSLPRLARRSKRGA